MKLNKNAIIRIVCLAAAFFLVQAQTFAQLPTGTPRTDEPVRLQSTSDIIIYLVLPLLVIVLGIFWWFFYKKPKNEQERERRKQR